MIPEGHTLRRNWFKFALAILMLLVQFPLMILFAIIRSAWTDCHMVTWWLRPALICPHGVDRNRAPCDDCSTKEELNLMASFTADEQAHTN